MRGISTALVMCLVMAACGTTAPSATPAPPAPTPLASEGHAATNQPTNTEPPTAGSPAAGSTADARTVGWQEDLHSLVPGMDALHPDLDHGISIKELNRQAEAVGNSAPTATDDEMMAGVLRIVASVSADGCDGHLGAYVWGSGTYPVDSLPLRLWLFDDGVYIVDALPPYEELIGKRVISMAGNAIDDVIATFDPIIPRDNDQTVRLLLPRFLLIPQIHHGLGLTDTDAGPMELEVGSASAPVDVAVDSISVGEYNIWAGPYGLHLPEDPDVLYLSRIGDDLWWQNMDETTLYVQYNRVERRILAGLQDALANESITRVVLDLRHNFGGEASVVEQFVPLFSDWVADHPGRLFVITGRNTFSAGATITVRLHDQTTAVVVGEPMGGCPTFWADVEPFRLAYSGIEVSVPTLKEVSVDPNDERQTIEPDMPTPLTVADWTAGVDPALDAILASDQ